MLLFKKKFLEQISAGAKTQTIRLWPHRKMRVGQRSYIPGAGYIQIEAVDVVALDSLDDADARLDGFDDAKALRREIDRLYPEGLPEGWQAFRIRFCVLNAEEQAAAIAAREAKKASKKIHDAGQNASA
jgi:hypothetical protein